MEGLLFIIILVVFNILRSAGRKQRNAPPPPRPPRRQPLQDQGSPAARDTAPFPGPGPGPVRRRIFLEDTLYRFPGKEEVNPPAARDMPAKMEDAEIRVPERPLFRPPAAVSDKKPVLFRDRDDLARGIILAEVLGPPLSKRKKRGFV